MLNSASLPLISLAFALVSCTLHPVSDMTAAARSGDVEKLRWALAKGEDVNERSGVNNWPVLMHAVHKNQPASVHVLLEAGADPNTTFGKGTTALIMAAGYGYANIVEDLMAHGADASIRDREGFGPLDAAVGGLPDIDRFTVGKCQGATVKAILDRAPGVRLQGASAVRIAKLSGCSEVLRLVAAR